MTTRTDEGYLLDNQRSEAERRFDALSDLFDATTFRHLEAVGVGPGWHCLEVGAGGPSVPAWLSDRVGPTGRVLATDIEPRWLAPLERPNVEVRRHEIGADPLPPDTFDLIHLRLVLTHVVRRDDAVASMAAALRPGGWLVVEDFDTVLVTEASLDPTVVATPVLNRVRAAFLDALAGRGVDLQFGRKLPRLLRRLGLVDVGADAYVTLAGRPAARRLERANVEQVGPAMVAGGLLEQADLDRFFAVIDAEELDVVLPALVSAWGRRPASDAGSGRADRRRR
ncbi:MAG TPA: methyltransferase domain-containing protein [Acidimicrobiales bacterium]